MARVQRIHTGLKHVTKSAVSLRTAESLQREPKDLM